MKVCESVVRNKIENEKKNKFDEIPFSISLPIGQFVYKTLYRPRTNERKKSSLRQFP